MNDGSQKDETCTFCGLPNYCGDTITPRMCEKHFSLALIGARIARKGQFVTTGAVTAELNRMTPEQRRAIPIFEDEVRDLLRQMTRENYCFGNGRRYLVIGEASDGNP